MSRFEPFLERSFITPLWEVSWNKSFWNLLLQGIGVYIAGSSTVTFEGCRIYSNLLLPDPRGLNSKVCLT